METLQLTSLDGGVIDVPRTEVDALSARVAGRTLERDSVGYEDARSIWNAMVDRRPSLIVRCTRREDVVACVDFARAHHILTSIRGGGHNIAGNALCDGGLTIDLSRMRAVRADGQSHRAVVLPGATLADLDAATLPLGFAVPTGINSTTGIAGLTLGGGFGWLSRAFGMTVDSLTSAQVVLASGEAIMSDETSHPDLFWGLRGGGGNFGVVTAFEFKGHPLPPQLLAGLIVHPGEARHDALNFYRDFTSQAPDELSTWLVMRKAPPLPFLPAAFHGTDVLILATLYVGDPEEGRRAMAPLLSFGSPAGMHVGPMPFADWQKIFDPLLTPGMRNYWKSHNFAELPDGLLDTLLRAADDLPGDQSEVFIAQLGGAQARVPVEATAWAHRDAAYVMNVHTRWSEAKDDPIFIDWARRLFVDAAPYATGGVYVNFMPNDETTRIHQAYGPHHARLAALKARYDPDNLFRVNQNIRPATAEEIESDDVARASPFGGPTLAP